MHSVDVAVIGAGASGMMCALTAARRGRRVLLLDHAAKLAEKIRISGGGRCNFTNLNAAPANFISSNPHFCRSALARYTPRDFIAMLQRHGVSYHEEDHGQLFCDEGSGAVIAMLKSECDTAGVEWRMPCKVEGIGRSDAWYLETSSGKICAQALVIASGGLSIPKIGATPFGFHVAEQFNIPIVKPRPGLVPLTMAPEDWRYYAELRGIALDADVRCGTMHFRESMLLTHRGLSGPAILQISSYWRPGETLHIDLLPAQPQQVLADALALSKQLPANFLAQHLPARFAAAWCAENLREIGMTERPLNQQGAKACARLAARLKDWQLKPSGTLGYGKAEVTCGGVDTRALSSKTMECTAMPGLYFIGEVLDVTGQLGGYNFQWAWASGHAAGFAV